MMMLTTQRLFHTSARIVAYRSTCNRLFSTEILLDHKHDAESDATISILTLNRPKANAMGKLFLTTLEDHLTDLESSKSRCLIITSSSPKVFSAGADLKERATMTITEAEAFVTRLRLTMQRLANLPLPTIASIEGVALGGGLEMALAADIRIVSSEATLGLPETSLAILPGAGGTQRLSRLIGASKTMELVFTGERINGQHALEIGLAQQVTEPGKANERAEAMAWKIAKNGPIAIRAAKEAIVRGMKESEMSKALEIERECYGRTLPTDDRLEGLAAFREGRTPVYKGK